MLSPRITSSARGPPSTTSINDNKRDVAIFTYQQASKCAVVVEVDVVVVSVGHRALQDAALLRQIRFEIIVRISSLYSHTTYSSHTM